MHEYSFVRIEESLINELYAVAFLGKNKHFHARLNDFDDT